MGNCSVYRCIHTITKQYFSDKYREFVTNRAIDYFLDKYIIHDGSKNKKRNFALSKTIEKMLSYSHEVKKQECLEVDWERRE